MTIPSIHGSWQAKLGDALSADTYQQACAFVEGERSRGIEIYPPREQVFRALELTPLDAVKVVIVGQDPYHGPGQAHGLSFSVRPGIPVPSSLRNIYKEMKDDLGHEPVGHGFLESWAQQGVLLLNTVLTVERGKPASHRKKGWEALTDQIVKVVSEKHDPVVFMLWGLHAQEKLSFLDEKTSRHRIIKSPHPSGLSAYKGFLGSRPFSRANDFLAEQGRGAIDWALPVEPTKA